MACINRIRVKEHWPFSGIKDDDDSEFDDIWDNNKKIWVGFEKQLFFTKLLSKEYDLANE